MRFVVLACSLLLSGCAAQVIASTPRGVVIDALDVGEATALAQAECQKHGRHARFTGEAEARWMTGYAFDCVR